MGGDYHRNFLLGALVVQLADAIAEGCPCIALSTWSGPPFINLTENRASRSCNYKNQNGKSASRKTGDSIGVEVQPLADVVVPGGGSARG